MGKAARKAATSLLAVIAGNTNVAFGFFGAGRMEWKSAVATGRFLSGTAGQAIPRLRGVDAVAFASVVDGAFEALAGYCESNGLPRPLRIPDEVPYPLGMAVRNPGTVGADRVLGAAAALDLAGGPAASVDFGTAVTVNAAWDGNFRGGAILPGRMTQAKALESFTSRLPAVGRIEPGPAIGLDTEEAISSGIVFGIAGAARELLMRFEREAGRKLAVFLTGGDGPVFAPLMPEECFLAPDLALKGVLLAVSNRSTTA